MPSRTLVATAVLFFIWIAPGCVTTSEDHQYWAYPMAMPQVNKVGPIGKYQGLPFTVGVTSNFRIGDHPVLLDLKVRNDRTFPVYPYPFGAGFTEESFAVWLLRDGHQVPLTEYGRKNLARYWDVSGMEEGNMGAEIMPGGSRVVQLDLSKIFQIATPGTYTVLAEKGPAYDFEEHGHGPGFEPAETSFTLLP